MIPNVYLTLLKKYDFQKFSKMTLCNDVINEICNYCDHMSLYNLLRTNKKCQELTKETDLFKELYKYKSDLSFLSVVRKGSLGLSKYLFDKRQEYEGFKNSCKYGHLEIAKWLRSAHLYNAEIGGLDGYRFCESCCYNHLEIAKWLYSFGNITFHSVEVAFSDSCCYGHLKVVQWLYSLFSSACTQRIHSASLMEGKIDIHQNEDLLFRISCSNGHLEVAQWLYSLGGVDIYAVNNYAFRKSFKYGKQDINDWLNSL